MGEFPQPAAWIGATRKVSVQPRPFESCHIEGHLSFGLGAPIMELPLDDRVKAAELMWEKLNVALAEKVHAEEQRVKRAIADDAYDELVSAYQLQYSVLFPGVETAAEGSVKVVKDPPDELPDGEMEVEEVKPEPGHAQDEEHVPDDPPKDGPPPEEDVPEWGNATCAVCSEPISVKVDEFSCEKYGRPLCWKHQRIQDAAPEEASK